MLCEIYMYTGRDRKTERERERQERERREGEMPENDKYKTQRIKIADIQRGSMSTDVHDITLTF